MENTTLQELLRTLTKPEWRNLGSFLQSPYHIRSEKFQRLYQQLNAHYPEFSFSREVRDEIYLKTAQVKAFSETGYRNLCSDFAEIVQRFLSVEFMDKNNSHADYILNRELVNRGLHTLAEKNMRKVEAGLPTRGLESAEKLRTKSWLNDVRISSSIRQNRNRIDILAETFRSIAPEKAHTEWLLSRVYLHLLNYIKACKDLNEPIDRKRIDPYLHLHEEAATEVHVEVTIMYHLVQLTFSADPIHYTIAKDLFFKNFEQMHSRDAENILVSLLDFANQVVGQNADWHQEVFELHDLKLRNKLYENLRYLSYISVYNAFFNAIQMGKTGYAMALVNEFVPDLHPNVQQPFRNLCGAWIDFMENRIDDAHTKLTAVDTENILIKYELRVLQCMVYYRNQTFDLLYNALESFRQFNQYNKHAVSANVNDQYSSFIRMMLLLMKTTPRPSNKKLEEILSAIRNEPTAYLKHWFIDTAGRAGGGKKSTDE